MDYAHRLEQANKATLRSAQPYDEDEIRRTALAGIEHREQEALKGKDIADLIKERDDLHTENVRLTEALRAVEREGVERKYWHNCYEPRAHGGYEQF